MGRPKGSKNKARTTPRRTPTAPPALPELVTPVNTDPVHDPHDDELDALEAATLGTELVDEGEEYDVDADEEQASSPPSGMTLAGAPTPEATTPRQAAGDALLGAIQQQTDTLTRMMPPKKVLISQFEGPTAFNPTGKRRRKLKSVVFQNGYRVNVSTLHDREIALINSGRIKPGQYINKIVTIRREVGAGGEIDKLFISYDNQTVDQRMTQMSYWKDFEELLTKCIAEAETRKTRLLARRRAELR